MNDAELELLKEEVTKQRAAINKLIQSYRILTGDREETKKK